MDKEEKGILLRQMTEAMAETAHIERYRDIEGLFENSKLNKNGTLTVKKDFVSFMYHQDDGT